ncbi:MAG: CoA-transferase [Pseudomonadota bacterium]
MAVRSIKPDFAFIHAPLADRHGNVWIGRHRGLMLMAHAAKATLVTAERIVDHDLLDDPDKGPATIPSLYVDAVAEAQRGAWPYGLTDEYDSDLPHLTEYLRLGATTEGFARYIDENVHGTRTAAE